jgi:cobalt-zinc-cadmium efflux system protein
MESNHNHSINYNRAFALGIVLNVGYVIVEFVYGLIFASMALIADAGHNLSDVLGLLLAWGASSLATKSSSQKMTYGYRKSTILAAFINSIILMVAVGAIAYESIGRFFNPQQIAGENMMIVAGIGVVINTITALLFMSGSKNDLNIKGAFLHMAADAGISAGVVVAGLLISITNFYWIDPAISLIIVIIITIGTWGLLKESFTMSMDAVPKGINLSEVRDFLLKQKNVSEVHDIHIWPLSTTETALTAHVIRSTNDSHDEFLTCMSRELHEIYDISHVTIQIEYSELEVDQSKICN